MKEIRVKAGNIPYRYEQMSFTQLLKYITIAELGWHYVLSVFIDASPDELYKAKVQDFDVVTTRLKFLTKPIVFDNTPSKLGSITIPKDVTFESVEQFEMMRKVYSDTKVDENVSAIDEYKKWAEVAAIYYQPIRDKSEFNYDRVTELMPEVYSLSCMEVASVGRFFWAKLVSLRSGIPVSSLLPTTPQKKKRQGLGRFLRRSISTLRSISSRREIS